MAMIKESELLEAAAQSLDIPDELHDSAVLKYNEIGDWLTADDSELNGVSPDIYPQGSFRLGTVVRPVGKEDQYDIDLVCRLAFQKDSITKADLKKKIGDRLKKNDEYKAILSESRRAWTLDFPHQFHLDVLSSIPNAERRPNGILLPDKDLHHWQKSNPITYADWFYDSMKVILREKRAAAAGKLEASIEEVPDWQVKTPLQRVVQILKRHRDINFIGRPTLRPVSIIITTLAAKSYQNQPDIFEALQSVVNGMSAHIERRPDGYWVPNPAEPEENFAERWNQYPDRGEAFFAWLRKARLDFASMPDSGDIGLLAEQLSPVIGAGTMTKAAAALGVRLKTAGAMTRTASIGDSVPPLGGVSHILQPNWHMAVAYKASITGTVHAKMFQAKVLWPLTNRPVPKGVCLRFAASTNVPWPYQVHWQIANTGREAEACRQLRGDFESPNSKTDTSSRWEGTLYAGTHLVEAFIVKEGRCVARSGQKKVRVRRS